MAEFPEGKRSKNTVESLRGVIPTGTTAFYTMIGTPVTQVKSPLLYNRYFAGLRPGDIIRRVNGQEVSNTSQFVRLIADSPIGSTVRLEFLRDGKPDTVRITVEQQQPRPRQRRQ